MNTKIIRDMESCYLVIDKETERGFQQKMVLHNRIKGIMPVEERQVDDSVQYYYRITNRISLRECVKRNSLSVERIRFILEEIIDLIQRAKEYLLEQSNFVLDIDCIFLEPDGGHIELCFCEGYHREVREQLLKITEFFMESIDYKDEKAVRLTYAIYKCLREDNCSFDTIISTMKGVDEEDRQAPLLETMKVCNNAESRPEPLHMESMPEVFHMDSKQTKIQKFYCIGIGMINVVALLVCFKTRCIFYHYSNAVSINKLLITIGLFVGINILVNQIWNVILQNHRVEIVDTNLFDEQGDTIVLKSSMCETHYHLKRENGSECILLTKFPFVIGSNKDCVQGFAPYPGVSRQHVMIQKNGEEITIQDLNSTNGTFLNGELIESKREYKMNDEDKITLGDVTYQLLRYYK